MSVAVLFRRSLDPAAERADREALAQWCRQRSHGDATWYEESDDDVFGRSRRRAVLDALVQDCRGGLVQTVIVPDLSALGGRAGDMLRVVDMIATAGARLIVVSPGWDLGAPAGQAARAWTRAVLAADGRVNGTRMERARRATGTWRQGHDRIVWTDDMQAAYEALRRQAVPVYRIAARRLVVARDHNGRPRAVSERWLRRTAEPRWLAGQPVGQEGAPLTSSAPAPAPSPAAQP